MLDAAEKKALDELKQLFEGELKPVIEEHGTDLAEVKQTLDRIQDAMDAKEAQFAKASFKPGYNTEQTPERKAHVEFLRKGIDKMEPDEAKLMRLSDETAGGVLAPADFIAEVVKGVVQYSPIRSIAKVRPTSRTSSQFPKRTQTSAAAWTGDTQARTETQSPRYGLDEIPNHELYARVLISNWDIEDPVVDLETDVRDDMAEQFGVSEGAGFVVGDANGKPEGMLTNTDFIANPILNGGASFANGDGLIKLAFSIKEQYWPNARYLLNRFSLRDIRLLKDSANNYLWQPAADGTHGLSSGLPATIYGYPYTIATDMPSAASNALPVVFADFQRLYWISDRIEIQYLRDPYSGASSGVVILHARKRVGGQVVLPEAGNVLKMA
jgi:HK97 family phage major capsid protein